MSATFIGPAATGKWANFRIEGLVYAETGAYGATWNTTATLNASLAKALKTCVPLAILTNSDKSSETKLFAYNGTAWKGVVIA